MKKEIDSRVRFFAYDNASQSEHVLSTNIDFSNDSPRKTGQNKRSLVQKNKKFLGNVSGKRLEVLE